MSLNTQPVKFNFNKNNQNQMNIIIKGLHMDLTSAIESYIKKKIKTIEKFCDENSKVEVIVGNVSKHHKSGNIFSAEIRVQMKGSLSKDYVESDNLYSAIDLVRDDILETLSSKKDKKRTLEKKGARIIKEMAHGEKSPKKKKKGVSVSKALKSVKASGGSKKAKKR